MTVHLSHPDGLLQQTDYAPVAVATGSRLLLLAGQVAVTPRANRRRQISQARSTPRCTTSRPGSKAQEATSATSLD